LINLLKAWLNSFKLDIYGFNLSSKI